MLSSSATMASDDVCIKCRVRRSPQADNPEYDEETEMQCILRSWTEQTDGGVFSFSGSAARRSGSNAPSPAGSDAGGRPNHSHGGGDITGSGVASAYLANEAKARRDSFGDGSHTPPLTPPMSPPALHDATNQGPEIIFKPIHANVGILLPSRPSTGSFPNRRFSTIRNRSTSGGRAMRGQTPPTGRSPSHSIDVGGDGTMSNPGSRSSSLPRSMSRGRVGSSLAAAAVFNTIALDESGGTFSSMNDSPYNSDSEHSGGNAPTTLASPVPAHRIAISDVVCADVTTEDDEIVEKGADGEDVICKANRVYLTTTSHGYFEVTFDSTNSHSVMVAFLKAVLPLGKVQKKITKLDLEDPSHPQYRDILHTSSCCTDVASRTSLDMEKFTAKEMNYTVQNETMFDKFKRRVAHIAEQCGGLSEQISESVCGGTMPSDNHTVDYSTGAFDSVITTPQHANKKTAVMDADGFGEMAEVPQISFEATPSKEEDDDGGFKVSEETKISSAELDRPTLNLKEPSIEQLMFAKNASNNGPLTPIGTSGSDAGSATEEHTDVHRATGFMQSVDI